MIQSQNLFVIDERGIFSIDGGVEATKLNTDNYDILGRHEN